MKRSKSSISEKIKKYSIPIKGYVEIIANEYAIIQAEKQLGLNGIKREEEKFHN